MSWGILYRLYPNRALQPCRQFGGDSITNILLPRYKILVMTLLCGGGEYGLLIVHNYLLFFAVEFAYNKHAVKSWVLLRRRKKLILEDNNESDDEIVVECESDS